MRNRAPVHEKLREDLKKKILDRRLPPGVMLSPENALTATYGISRPSVRKALAELESERLIVRRPGLGTFVGDIDLKKARPDGPDLIGIDLSESDMESWYYLELLKGARKGCHDMNCGLFFFDEDDFSRMPDTPLKGLILTRFDQWPSEKVDLLRRRGVPVVALNRFPVGMGCNWVAADFEKASFKAVEHLIQLGHRRIGVVADDNPPVGGARRKGYLEALAKYKIPIAEDLIFVRTPGQNIMDDAMAFLRDSGATAYFFANASYFGSYFSPALSRLQIRIPEKVSIIVFEDIEGHVPHHGPALSCVRVPLRDMGRRAAQIVAGHSGGEVHEIFACELVIRESCGSV